MYLNVHQTTLKTILSSTREHTLHFAFVGGNRKISRSDTRATLEMKPNTQFKQALQILLVLALSGK
jgi:hypothetical protein